MNASKRILVVEDEGVVARDLQRSLSDLGYWVPETASSSEQAIRLVSDHRPDLVLMDIRLKGKRDGISTAALLKADFAVPVVYLTAYADAQTVERAKVTEPLGYLLKPVRPEELRSTVELALHRHETEQRLREREHWLQTTLDSIGQAVISTDARGKVNYMNAAAESLTGQRLTEAMGCASEQVFSLLDEQTRSPLENPMSRVLCELEVAHGEAMLVRPDGSECLVAENTSPIVDARGRILGAVMVFHDCSQPARLRCQSTRSEGFASVSRLIPMSAPEPPAIALRISADHEPSGSAANFSVLVIDDEPMVRAMLERVLGERHLLVCPQTSLEALALIDAGQRFDLILCDLMMPELSGAAFHAELARRFPDQARRIAFLTGGALSPETLRFMHKIPNPFLEKPFDTKHLRQVVGRLLLELGSVVQSERTK